MGLIDLLKKAFMEGYATSSITIATVLMCIGCTMAIAIYIYLIYKIVNRNSFYNKGFNISLVIIAVITAAIILTIQSNIVVSLGMVGALSIVRFRTAIKDPMDLAFLFWSISAGIICGAGFAGIAVVASLFVTVLIILFSASFKSASTLVLVVNAQSNSNEEEIMKVVREFCKYSRIRARNVSKSGMNMAVEVKTSKPSELIAKLMNLSCISDASLVENDSEIF
ncbi:MAG: DUF4956 domain-containing protein [Clostridia bacterium]|jgi:uncharacterized membrane protein YhiD involved in acid resistance|nr:DUF4956 domain-containing protein [Clostridia bacterium]